MTDYERKMAELRKMYNVDDIDTYETTNDCWVITVFEAYLTFTEYLFNKTGKYICQSTTVVPSAF